MSPKCMHGHVAKDADFTVILGFLVVTDVFFMPVPDVLVIKAHLMSGEVAIETGVAYCAIMFSN